jgi:RNA polymerase sigma factor (TIGR02999 family)
MAMAEDPRTVTRFAADERASLDELMPAVYAELHRLAGYYMAHEHAGHTLQTTDLLHEAYLRMAGQRTVDWRNRAHLLAMATRAMRRVLLDHAAAARAVKRGGELSRVTLTDEFALHDSGGVDLIDVDCALEQLKEIDPQQAAVVELRFFGGMSNEEIAEVLKTSPATVGRRWASARLWLARRLAELARG